MQGMIWSLFPPPVSWLSSTSPTVKNLTWGKFLTLSGLLFHGT